jgi:hypothetical protein
MVKRKKTGGRKKGAKNKRTARVAAEIAASGITPKEYMLELMRTPCPPDLLKAVAEGKIDRDICAGFSNWHSMRFEAAKAVAPYVHPKLQTTEMTGKIEIEHKLVESIPFDAIRQRADPQQQRIEPTRH